MKALIVSCFDHYATRLKPIKDFLVKNEYNTVILTSDFNHVKKEPISEKHPACTYLTVPEYKKNISISRIYSHFVFAYKVKRFLNQYKPDLIYVLIPTNLAAKYCNDYKKTNNVILIADIIDLWPESLPLKQLKNTFFANVWRDWRNHCISNADHVYTECNLYQEKLKNIINMDKVCTLHLFSNVSDNAKSEILNIINNKKKDSGKTVKLAYLGSMNHIIDIDGICRVIKCFIDKGLQVELHAIGGGDSQDIFLTKVKETGCQIFFYGIIFDELEKVRILTPCDYALNMMKETSEVGLTIKSVDYLSMGLPLLNNIKGDTWNFVKEEHIGVNIGNDNDWMNKLCSVVPRQKIVQFYFEHFTETAFTHNVTKSLTVLLQNTES